MKCGEIREFTAWAKGKNTAPFPLRIVVVRKDKQSAEKALRKSTYESKRKGYTPKIITLFMAQFIVLGTNLSEKDVTKEAIAEAFRWRWQIELEFKRFKSTTYIRKLVNQKDSTVEVYILASLVAWLLSYKIAKQKSFFPWGYPLS
jgi:IS4 transposase